jgi:hypothetical protein
VDEIVSLNSFLICSLFVAVQKSIFHMHIDCFLYPAALLKVFLRAKKFLVEVLGFFRYKIMSSANRDNLIFSFSVLISFITFSCLIFLTRNSRIY